MTVGGKTNPGAHRDAATTAPRLRARTTCPSKKMILLSMILSISSLSGAHRDAATTAPRLRAQTTCSSKKMILLSMLLSISSLSSALMTPLQGERLGSHRQPLQGFKIKFSKSRLFRKNATHIYGCLAFFKTTCW